MYGTHEMRMVRIDESGLEEWACPTCGRRMLLRWPPHYEKQIVDPGDERAGHVGSSSTTADTPPGTPAGTPAAAHNGTHNGTSNGAEDDTTGPPKQASERQWRKARRWLRESGVDATPAQAARAARSHLGPSEPV
ncbi:hypothetical protein [Actinomadura sp. 3N508]|uniref:hypothetical protein n=1 Tax=Actinomadura sp. 3N508 TaxID=3375153 RepID=UPI003795FD51